MKKEYTHPQVKAHIVMNNVILAGSISADSGYTSEQNAKGTTFEFTDNED